jgi:hypothetical protein
MSVESLVIHEKVAGNRDAQFHALNQIKIQISNKTPPGLLLVWMVPVVSDQPWSVIVGGGGVKTLPFCLGTTYNLSSMEDTEISWLLC